MNFFIWIYVLLTEIFFILISIIVYPFRSSRIFLGKKETSFNILCVHGYLHNQTGWWFFRRFLKTKGFDSVNTVSYPSFSQDIRANSLRIKQRIEQIHEKSGKQVNLLIGHSLGGLASLEYALEHAPKDRTIYIITMGSPLRGSILAKKWMGKTAQQMMPNSEYLQSLHQRLQKARHIRLFNLASKTDPLVFPVSSAQLPELPYAYYETIDALGHIVFLYSPRALNQIISYLRGCKKI